MVNDGVGTFTKTVITAQSSISSIGIGDIDGDGVSDLVVASYNRVFVYWGYSVSNGAVAFEQNSSTVFDYSTWTWYYGNTVPDSLIIEDFDGDGKDEISFDVYYGWSMFKYSRIYEYNNTALNYTQSPRSNFSFDMVWYSTTATGTLQANKLMDMNNDGNDDFVRCHSNSIQIYNSSGDYFSVAPWNLSVSGKNCMLFDATLDGTPDLLSINGSTIEVRMGPDYNYLVMTKVIYAITEFKIYDMDQDGLLELLIATSENKRMRIHDLDTTGIIGQIWEGGSYSNTRSVTIGDFNNDGRPDVLQQNSGSAWDLIYGIQDTDYDTLGDTDDVFPMDPTQKTDSDGDGYGDSKIGMMGDNCTYYWGDSQYDQRGCPDQDGDGWSDLGDDFWREPTQWKDTDGDGFGDNHDGSSSRLIHWPGEFIENAYNPDPSPLDFDNDGFEDEELSMVGIDDCPKEAGWSFEDRFGCLDTDGDGWSNNDQQGFWTKGDKFPNDFTQHNDTDGDGFGDNIDGTQGDSCPTVSGKSFRDRFGCPDNDKDGWSEDSDFDDNDPSKWGIDSDGDGISDDNDHFPNDPQQSRDSDNDGYGDSAGDYGDACPGQEGYSYIDKYGCSDTDDDGVSDQGDKCPTIPGWSSEPWLGCPDSDDDGIADIIDAFPDNSNETRDKDQDGIGDNADICTHSLDNLTIDCSEDYDNDGFADLEDKFPADAAEWIDSDGDGVGDNGDVWPLDGDIWSDADGDLWADQFGHILTDDCPSLNGTSSIFMNGCSDLDEDGMPDILDPDIDGDGITNDNEMDASTKTVTYDPFDADSKPSDIDGDLIPDVLDHDRDGDGFPDELERERGSDYKDANKTPFNKYGNQDTGLFYVPGEGFKSQYDPEGVEISVSWLIDLITSELLVPLAMIPLTVFALMRKRRRYKKMRNRLEDCKDLDMLKEYEEDIDDMVINRKVKVEHGMLLRNMFERMKEQFEDQEQVRLLGGKSSAGSGGMGRGGNMQQSGPMIPERLRKQGMGGPGGSPGQRRPGGRY